MVSVAGNRRRAAFYRELGQFCSVAVKKLGRMISVLFFGKAPNVAAGPLLGVMTDPLKSAPFSWAKPSQSAPATLFFGRIRSESCHVGRNEMAGLKDPRKGPSINENGK
jgi:hypothetical protein